MKNLIIVISIVFLLLNACESQKVDKPKTENIETVRIFRLILTEATVTIIKKGLYLLGIATVERM